MREARRVRRGRVVTKRGPSVRVAMAVAVTIKALLQVSSTQSGIGNALQHLETAADMHRSPKSFSHAEKARVDGRS